MGDNSQAAGGSHRDGAKPQEIKMMKPAATEAKMNKAEAAEPKSGHRAPAGARGGNGVGNERTADTKGALMGQPTDGMKHGGHAGDSSMAGAVRELKEQHPIEYHDHGPHHGHDHHIRHEPLHGMRPGKR